MQWLKKHEIGVIALLFSGFALLAFLNLDRLSADTILGIAESSMWLSAIILLLLYVLRGFIMALPIGLLYIAAGIAFPTWLGIGLTYVGLTVSMSVGYFLGNRLGEEKVKTFFADKKKVLAFLYGERENLLLLSFVSRILPMPFCLSSMFFGALKLRYIHYIISSLLGLSPYMLPVVIAGAAISNPLSAAFLVPFGISIAIFLVSFWVYRKWKMARSSQVFSVFIYIIFEFSCLW